VQALLDEEREREKRLQKALTAGEVRLEVRTAMKQVANRNAKVGHGGDRERPLNDGHNPNLRGVSVHASYGLQSCRGKSAGVAKRPRERSPTRNPSVTFRNFICIAV
jgi:hypothetical protein